MSEVFKQHFDMRLVKIHMATVGT